MNPQQPHKLHQELHAHLVCPLWAECRFNQPVPDCPLEFRDDDETTKLPRMETLAKQHRYIVRYRGILLKELHCICHHCCYVISLALDLFIFVSKREHDCVNFEEAEGIWDCQCEHFCKSLRKDMKKNIDFWISSAHQTDAYTREFARNTIEHRGFAGRYQCVCKECTKDFKQLVDRAVLRG
jgi:hypothetical protein